MPKCRYFDTQNGSILTLKYKYFDTKTQVFWSQNAAFWKPKCIIWTPNCSGLKLNRDIFTPKCSLWCKVVFFCQNVCLSPLIWLHFSIAMPVLPVFQCQDTSKFSYNI
jgi:hypothetical protein